MSTYRYAYRSRSDDDTKKGFNWIGAALGAAFIVPLVMWLFPSVIPFSFFQFWELKVPLVQAVSACWPIFVWGVGLNVVKLFQRNDYGSTTTSQVLGVGLLVSAWAGIMEEICFRWLIFLNAIWVAKFANLITFGLVQWIYLSILCPLANFFTLGYLTEYIFHPASWAVGAAMISTNGKFRDGHAYQGPLGWLNSWFCGMFFFGVMFQYGLLAAIVVHFLYDLFIFILAAFDVALEKALGW